jgi:hypothetical protein
MTFEYQYNPAFNPNIEKIASDVRASEMTNTNIERCKWEGRAETPVLKVYFDQELSAGDKTILDGIVDSSGVFQETRSRESILGEILESCQDQPQVDRLFTAVRNDDVFVFALDNFNYALARQLATAQEAAGTITQADLDLVLSIIPTVI